MEMSHEGHAQVMEKTSDILAVLVLHMLFQQEFFQNFILQQQLLQGVMVEHDVSLLHALTRWLFGTARKTVTHYQLDTEVSVRCFLTFSVGSVLISLCELLDAVWLSLL